MVPPTSHKVSRVSWYSGSCSSSSVFPYGAFTLSGRLSQYRSGNLCRLNAVRNTAVHAPRFRLFPVRSQLLRKSFFIFSSSGYLDVSVPRVPSLTLWIHVKVTGHYSRRVSPFGYLRINACLQLPAAYRSLPRPSSAYGALASTLRSY